MVPPQSWIMPQSMDGLQQYGNCVYGFSCCLWQESCKWWFSFVKTILLSIFIFTTPNQSIATKMYRIVGDTKDLHGFDFQVFGQTLWQELAKLRKKKIRFCHRLTEVWSFLGMTTFPLQMLFGLSLPPPSVVACLWSWWPTWWAKSISFFAPQQGFGYFLWPHSSKCEERGELACSYIINKQQDPVRTPPPCLTLVNRRVNANSMLHIQISLSCLVLQRERFTLSESIWQSAARVFRTIRK